MRQQAHHDRLDRLLAQPPQIADRGFTGQLQSRLGKTSRARPVIFAAAAIIWVLLALAAISYEEVQFAWQRYMNLTESILTSQFLPEGLVGSTATLLQADYMLLGSVSLACVALVSLLRLGRT
ncbi:MAG: hypothetical protein RL120_02240 [Gammaproteobacteria bacterium]